MGGYLVKYNDKCFTIYNIIPIIKQHGKFNNISKIK